MIRSISIQIPKVHFSSIKFLTQSLAVFDLLISGRDKALRIRKTKTKTTNIVIDEAAFLKKE